ncbi:Mediator of DNA damage checkpoint protein 1, partial [Perkinsus olseni]
SESAPPTPIQDSCIEDAVRVSSLTPKASAGVASVMAKTRRVQPPDEVELVCSMVDEAVNPNDFPLNTISEEEEGLRTGMTISTDSDDDEEDEMPSRASVVVSPPCYGVLLGCGYTGQSSVVVSPTCYGVLLGCGYTGQSSAMVSPPCYGVLPFTTVPSSRDSFFPSHVRHTLRFIAQSPTAVLPSSEAQSASAPNDWQFNAFCIPRAAVDEHTKALPS